MSATLKCIWLYLWTVYSVGCTLYLMHSLFDVCMLPYPFCIYYACPVSWWWSVWLNIQLLLFWINLHQNKIHTADTNKTVMLPTCIQPTLVQHSNQVSTDTHPWQRQDKTKHSYCFSRMGCTAGSLHLNSLWSPNQWYYLRDKKNKDINDTNKV